MNEKRWGGSPLDYISRNQASFNRKASEFDRGDISQLLSRQYINRFQMLLNGNRVLDMGSGLGMDALRLRGYELEVHGLDISEAMVEEAKRRIEGVEFIQGDFRYLYLNDDYFDGIWANLSLIYLTPDDLSTALEEVYRVMKPGAVFFSSYLEGSGEKVIDAIYHHYYRKEEVLELMRQQGFKIFQSMVTGDEQKFIIVYVIK
jgi:ubiquinone/menaquinone biosynthesis C-methylase UbiE